MGLVHEFSISLAHHIELWVVQGGYVALFLTTMLEAIPLVGVVVPGHVAIIAGGFMAKLGVLNLWWAIFWSTIGTLVGDYVAYLLGQRYGLRFVERLRKYIFVRQEHLDKAQDLMKNHLKKAIVFGRISPMTRALIPYMLGSARAPMGEFWLYSIISGFVWIGGSVFLGYLFGASYHAVSGYMGRAMVFALIIGALIVWGYRFVNTRFHIFAKYELFVLSINISSLIVLARLMQDALVAHPFLSGLDISINLFISSHVSGVLVEAASLISDIGGPSVLGVAALLVGAGYLVCRRWRTGSIILLSVVSTSVATTVMKEIFLRVRPDNALVMASNSSFPSGHSSLVAAVCIVAAYFGALRIKSWVKRETFIVLCVLVAALVGVSRIVLSVHWTTDVIAGWSLGVFLATSSILFIKYLGVILTKKSDSIQSLLAASTDSSDPK